MHTYTNLKKPGTHQPMCRNGVDHNDDPARLQNTVVAKKMLAWVIIKIFNVIKQSE